MSSVPPNMPPGGGPPYPPYDSKAQWRAYREQQKAAWRAQRDAWRAQTYAWKTGYVGAYGPRVPSIVGPVILISIGVVALLVITGHLDAARFWGWYAHWWPLLLIGAGVGLLAEWALDMRRKTPVRRGGSFVGIIILLALLGFAASGWHHVGPFVDSWGNDNGDLFNMFGLPEHDLDKQVLNTEIPANATVDVENPRGDVSVTASESSTMSVQAHEVAFADSDSDAQNIFAAEAPDVRVSGSAVLVKTASNNNGRVNLNVTVPKTARITINAGKGDVTVAGLGEGLSVTSARGDVHLSAISGSVDVRFTSGKHDFSAHQIDGDLTANGDCSDLALSEIKGRVTVNGQIFGDVHVENVRGPLSVHTSVTDVQIAELPGDLTFDSDDLHVTDSKGLVHVVTHSKDVDLSQIYGDSYVEDRDGRVSIEPAGSYNVEAKNGKGDVELTLPPDTSATVDGHTHNGDIVSEYSLTTSGEQDKSIAGRIGSGQARIVLSSSNGDLRIKKGPAFPPAPSVAAAPAAPSAPAPPNARHLKSPKALPEQPVTQ